MGYRAGRLAPLVGKYHATKRNAIVPSHVGTDPCHIPRVERAESGEKGEEDGNAGLAVPSTALGSRGVAD